MNRAFLAQLLFLLLLLIKPCFSYTLIKPYDMQSFDEEIHSLYQSHLIDTHDSINQKIEKISAYFLGRPYQIYNMGEGASSLFDQNPLYRTDSFDCETYVMMVTALSRGHDLDSFKKQLTAINYAQNQIEFKYRNHFTAVQWNINNAQKTIIRDITKTIYPDAVTTPAIVDVNAWFKTISPNRLQVLTPLTYHEAQQRLTQLRETRLEQNPLRGAFNMIPRQALLSEPKSNVLKQIPSGAIIEVIKATPATEKAYVLTPYYIPHIGFVIQKNHQTWFREASKRDHRVEDIALKKYLQYQTHLVGISVWAVVYTHCI